MIIVLCLTGIYICIVICTKLPQHRVFRIIILNYFAYLEVAEELPTDFIRQFDCGNRRDNARYRKIEYIILAPSYSDDTLSLMISPVLAPTSLYNQFCRIVS